MAMPASVDDVPETVASVKMAATVSPVAACTVLATMGVNAPAPTPTTLILTGSLAEPPLLSASVMLKASVAVWPRASA